MFTCLDCGEEMELDPSDYELDDVFYCDACGASHIVTSIDDEDNGISFELLDEDK